MSPNKPRRKRLFPQTAKDCLEPIIGPALKQRGFAHAKLLTGWAEIVGPTLAQHSRPLSVRNHILHIAVASHCATEIHYAQPQILERISTFLGYKAVTKITIAQQAPATSTPTHASIPLLPKSPFAPTSAETDGDAFDQALASLAKTLQEPRRSR